MKNITVNEFCRKETRALELCIIREDGWIVAAVWIDCEDIFRLPQSIVDKTVISDEWGTLNIIDGRGRMVKIPCHYINI